MGENLRSGRPMRVLLADDHTMFTDGETDRKTLFGAPQCYAVGLSEAFRTGSMGTSVRP
jgi:hypothetical protein